MPIVSLKEQKITISGLNLVDIRVGPTLSPARRAWRFLVNHQNWSRWMPGVQNALPLEISTRPFELGRGSKFTIAGRFEDEILEFSFWDEYQELRYELYTPYSAEGFAIQLRQNDSLDRLTITLRGETQLSAWQSRCSFWFLHKRQHQLNQQIQMLAQSLRKELNA